MGSAAAAGELRSGHASVPRRPAFWERLGLGPPDFMAHWAASPTPLPAAPQVSDVLEQWIALQRAWMYLEPIFSSGDVQEQLPAEAKRFAAVDRGWRKTMESTRRAPGVLKVRGRRAAGRAGAATISQATRYRGHGTQPLFPSPPHTHIHTNARVCRRQVCCSRKLLDSLTESNRLLEGAQKGLADYLETKRLAFSRWEAVCVWGGEGG